MILAGKMDKGIPGEASILLGKNPTIDELIEFAKFEGSKAFPYHKRAAALRTKQILKTSTPEEGAELAGILEFDLEPDKARPIGVILVQKECLRTITPDEAQQLKRLRALVKASEEFVIKRGIELAIKEILGTITEAELAELKALREFTFGFRVDHRGVELRVKDILTPGSLTEDEESELLARATIAKTKLEEESYEEEEEEEPTDLEEDGEEEEESTGEGVEA